MRQFENGKRSLGSSRTQTYMKQKNPSPMYSILARKFSFESGIIRTCRWLIAIVYFLIDLYLYFSFSTSVLFFRCQDKCRMQCSVNASLSGPVWAHQVWGFLGMYGQIDSYARYRLPKLYWKCQDIQNNVPIDLLNSYENIFTKHPWHPYFFIIIKGRNYFYKNKIKRLYSTHISVGGIVTFLYEI